MQLSPKTNPTKKLYKSMSLALDISQSKPKSEPVDDHALLLSESSMQEEENSSPEKGKLPLKNMIVYVEIYSNDNNISEASFGYLENLGAKIEKRMNKKCNLVIWKDGSMKTVERAKEYGIPVVNSLWLEECIESHICPDFEKYAPALPNQEECPFISAQERKKRKAQDPLNPEEDFTFSFESLMKSSKPAPKKKKSEGLSKIEEKITIKLDSKKKILSEDNEKARKSLRRSQTANPTLGSWLLDFGKNKNDGEDEYNNDRNNRDDRKRKGFGSILGDNSFNKTITDYFERETKADTSHESNFNIDSLFKKKEEEDHSSKIRSLLSKYTKPTSFDNIEERASSKEDETENNKNSFLDRSRKSDKSNDSEDRYYNGKKSWLDDEDDDYKAKNSTKELFTVSHRSYSMGNKVDSPILSSETKLYSLHTRILLREEEDAYNERKAKEKAEGKQRDSYGRSTLDIGEITRAELMKLKKIEKPDERKISELWMKYGGKADATAKQSEEKTKLELEVIKSKKESEMEQEKKEKVKDNSRDSLKEGVLRRSTRSNETKKTLAEEEEEKNSLIKKKTEKKISFIEEEFSEEETRISKVKEKDGSKDPVSRSQSKVKLGKDSKDKDLQTPQKKLTKKESLDKSTAAKSTKSITSGSSSLNQTPETKGSSYLISSAISKYLDTTSSKTSNTETKRTEEESLSSLIKGSKKNDVEKKEEKTLPKRETRSRQKSQENKEESKHVSNFSSDEEEALKPQAKSTQNGKDEKKTKETKLNKEDDILQKTIKKKTNDASKKESYIIFSGFIGEALDKPKKFCEKFGLKLLEDELRNLSRTEMLVYEGKEVPKNYRVAYTMARGKPILSKVWFEESSKKGKLEDQKQYEHNYDSVPRKKLFNEMRFYIDKEFEELSGNVLQKKDLVSLIETCGGKVLDNVRICDFCVNKKGAKPSIEIPPHVKQILPQWIIDSVIEGKCLNTNNVNYSSK